MADNENQFGNIDFSFFTSDEAKNIQTTESDSNTSIDKPKRTRKPKVVEDGATPTVTVSNPTDYSNVDYNRTYAETANMLRGAIAQADIMNSEIKSDIDSVRSSKTLKNKYTYITNLTASAGTLLNTKIQAIRELNSSITNAHNLELNRAKALKLEQNAQNDEMRIMDLYSAFVNAPVGTYTPQGPSIVDITVGPNGMNSPINTVEMIGPAMNENLTPEQIRMRTESNPNIQTVVRFEQSTGRRYFDVIDTSTGASVPNYPRPDNFLLEDTTIDIHAGIARNRNVNQVWPLLTDGNINEY